MFFHLALTMVVVELSMEQPTIPENIYEVCSLELDRGDACCSKPNNTIRFFFDPELDDCFTYLYEGCGGGRNTFYEEHECRVTCIPADKQICAGNKQPTGGCGAEDRSCPAGSTCQVGGLGVGICCDDANEKEWEDEVSPKCAVGDVLLRTVDFGSTVWLGKSCAHRFCPYGYNCIQTKRIAHCCGPIPNFQEQHFLEDNTVKLPDAGTNNPPALSAGKGEYLKVRRHRV